MNFLFPTFLFAAATIAIPIVIHLFQFRRYKKVFFPNIQFLKEVKEQTSQQNKLKHLLVLLCRVLAIIFAVLAFAQPFIKQSFQPNSIQSNHKAVSIFIDNSFSMNLARNGVPLIELAKQKATEIVKSYGVNTQFQIVSNELTGLQQHLITYDEALKAIDELKLSFSSNTFDVIRAKQMQALQTDNKANTAAFFISDFQKSQYQFTKSKADTSLIYFAIPLKSDEAQNISIDSCWFETPAQTLGQQVNLIVKISNYSDADIESNRLTLSLNNELKYVGDISLLAESTIYDTLKFTIAKFGSNNGVISINDKTVTFDDTYYFAFDVANKIEMLCINEQAENSYINAVFKNDKQFNITNNNTNQINFNQLSKVNCLILNQLKSVSSGLTNEVQKFVKNGGSLLIIPSDKMDANAYNAFLETLKLPIIEQLVTETQKVTFINTKIEVFNDVFEKLTDNIDLPEVKKYYQFSNTKFTNEEPLLKLKNTRTLISKFSFEKGSIFLLATPLDKQYTDLPTKAIYVPLMYKISLSGIKHGNISYTMGLPCNIQLPYPIKVSEPTFSLKNKNQQFIPQQMSIENNILLHIQNEINQSGVFELLGISDSIKPAFAFNYNRSESNVHLYSDNELKDELKRLNINYVDGINKNMASFISEVNQGIVLWKWFLLAALLLLFTEVLLLRFWHT